MKRIRNTFGLVLMLALVAALAGHSSAGKGGGGKPGGGDDGPTITPIPYSITYLDTLPGFDSNFANGMNNHGEVVGSSHRAVGRQRAFLYTNDTANGEWETVSLHEKFKQEGLIQFDDSTNTGTFVAYARDISDVGEIIGLVGELVNDQVVSSASFRYTPGFVDEDGSVPPQLVLLNTLDGGHAFVDSINNNGDIVGDGMLWKSNDFDEHNGNLNPTPLPGVRHISNGYVCGSSDGIAWRASLVAGAVGPYQDLGTLFPKAKTVMSGATSVNDEGEVAGYSQDRSKPFQILQHGFRYSNGTMQDLGTLGGDRSNAYSINNHGHVVGIARIASGDFHMYLYTDDGITDLEAAIVNLQEPLEPNGNLGRPVNINDYGEIFGTTESTGRAYILRPIIEL